MNDGKILFVYPPAGKQKKWEYSLGLSYIEAYLKKYGIKSRQFIPSKETTLIGICDEIIANNPNIIGFSCYDTNYYYIKLIAETIKKKRPDIFIIMGGPTATFSWKLVMEDCCSIDIVSIGEGEETTLELINEYYKGKVWQNIKGIVYRDGKHLVKTSDRPLVENIDDFPSPYISNVEVELNERIVVLTSRGCIYNCTYCNCTIMCGKRIRYHSVERVISELEYISKNIKNKRQVVLIGDDAFTLDIERAKIICKEIIKRKLGLRLFCETRADRMDIELLQLMKKAGFIKIDFGLETASPRVMREIKKVFFKKGDNNFSSEKYFINNLLDVVDKSKKIGLNPMVNVISGLPTETIDDAIATINYIKNLNIKNYSHNILRIYAGTELFNNYMKYGYEIYNSPFLLPYIVKHPIDVLKIPQLDNSINRHEIIYMKNLVKQLFDGGNSASIINSIIYEGKNTECSQEIKKIFLKTELNDEVFINNEETISVLASYKIPSTRMNLITPQKNGYYISNYTEKNINVTIKRINSNEKPICNSVDSIFLLDIQSEKEINDICEYKTFNPFINPSVIVKNHCKFCGEKCPLIHNIRGKVSLDKAEVDVCFTGKKIKIADFYERKDVIFDAIYKKRDCEKCIVNEKCPKCLFPFPIGEEEYCNIMRRYSFNFNDYDLIYEFCRIYKKDDDVKKCLCQFKEFLGKDFKMIEKEDFQRCKSILSRDILDFFNFYKTGYVNGRR